MSKQKRILRKMNRRRTWFGVAALCCILIMLVGVSFAWFSSNISFLNGYVTLGEMQIETTVYRPVYDENSQTITGIEKVDAPEQSDASAATIAPGLIAADSIGEGILSTRYLKVENKGTMDVRLLLNVLKDEELEKLFGSQYYDSGYFKLSITDITDSVNGKKDEASLKTDAALLYSGDQSAVIAELSGEAYQLNQLKDMTISVGGTDHEILEGGSTGYYRFDFFCENLPATVLNSQSADSGEKELALNVQITAQQSNAPWSESAESSGDRHEVNSLEGFLNAVESAGNGDTIILTGNIELADDYNLTFYHRVNLYLNGYTLKVKGNMIYDYADSGTLTLDVTETSSLVVYGDFKVNTPNASFTIVGSGTNSVRIGNSEENGTFSVNCVRDYTDGTAGFVLDNVSVINAKDSTAKNLLVYGNTAVTIGTNSKVGTVSAAMDARNIAVINNGSVKNISLKDMRYWKAGQSRQIYIENNGKITVCDSSQSAENYSESAPACITLPSWSRGAGTASGEGCNTTVVQGAGVGGVLTVGVSLGGNYYSADSCAVFKESYQKWEEKGLTPDKVYFWNQDVENNTPATGQKVEWVGTNAYLVTLDSSEDRVGALMDSYFADGTRAHAGEQKENLKSLTIRTYGDANVSADDFTYIKTNFYAGLETLDLSGAALEDNTIPADAMYGKNSVCGKLKNLVLPATVETIGKNAFRYSAIEELSLPASVKSVGANAFLRDEAKNKKVYVTWTSGVQISNAVLSGFETSYARFFMNEYNALDIGSVNSFWEPYAYDLYDFSVQDGDTRTFLKIIGGGDKKNYARIVFYETTGSRDSLIQSSYTSPDDGKSYAVKSIGVNAYRAFCEAAKGAEVKLLFPDTCTEIRTNAFRPVGKDSSSGEVTLQISELDLNMVDSIGAYAFYHARIMYSYERPGSFAGMTYLGSYAFGGVGFYPESSRLTSADKMTPEMLESYQSAAKTFYKAGTLDLHTDKSVWSGSWNDANVTSAVEGLTAAAGILNLSNYHAAGTSAADTYSAESGLKLYGVRLELNGCENIADSAFAGCFPEPGLQKYNELDIRNVKGFGASAFSSSYIATVYAGGTDGATAWGSTADSGNSIFENGSVSTLDLQGYMPDAKTGSLFGGVSYETVYLHDLAEDTEVSGGLFNGSVIGEVRIDTDGSVTLGEDCFRDLNRNAEAGTEVSIRAGKNVTFQAGAWNGAKLKTFALQTGADAVITVGSGAFYNVDFSAMDVSDFTSFYRAISAGQDTALIQGSTFPDNMDTLDLSEGSPFAVKSAGQYSNCVMSGIQKIIWQTNTAGTAAAYTELFYQTTWPKLTTLDLSGAVLPGSAFEGADLHTVTGILLNADTSVYTSGEGSEKQFAGADLSGLKECDWAGITKLSKGCFYGVKVSENTTWTFSDLTAFEGAYTFANIKEGNLKLVFPKLTSCLPEGDSQQTAQFDSSSAVYWIEFGDDMKAMGGSGDEAVDGLADYGADASELRGLTKCTIVFQYSKDVVYLPTKLRKESIGEGVRFIVPNQLLEKYRADSNWKEVASLITAGYMKYQDYTYRYVGDSSADQVQLVAYNGTEKSLVVPEYITFSGSDASGAAGSILKVTELSDGFLTDTEVTELTLPSSISYISPAMFDGTMVQTIRFYSSGENDGTVLYYQAEKKSSGEVTLADGTKRAITSTGQLLLNEDGTVLLRAMPGASYAGDYAVPDTVRGIGSGAFRGTGITSLYMSGVTSIAGDAFADNDSSSSGSSLVTLKFAMATPPLLLGDALSVFRTTDLTNERVQMTGNGIAVPEGYAGIYQAAVGFTAYAEIIYEDSAIAPNTDLLTSGTYFEYDGVSWYYELDEAEGTAVLTGIKSGLPVNEAKTFFIPAAVSDGERWYPVSAMALTDQSSDLLKEVERYAVEMPALEDGTAASEALLCVDEYGVLYQIGSGAKRTATLLRYPANAGEEQTEYTVPVALDVNGTSAVGLTETGSTDRSIRVTKIASYAFANAGNLKALYIPSAVLRKIGIEENAFAGTGDEFTVFGGDDAKADVAVSDIELDQETWEKIQKWLNGESEESDLPKEPENPDDTGASENTEVSDGTEAVDSKETLADTEYADDTENTGDSDYVDDTESGCADYVDDTENSDDTAYSADTEFPGDTEYAPDTEYADDAEYLPETESLNEAEYPSDTENLTE